MVQNFDVAKIFCNLQRDYILRYYIQDAITVYSDIFSGAYMKVISLINRIKSQCPKLKFWPCIRHCSDEFH